MIPKLIPLNVKTRPNLRQMVRTFMFNLSCNFQHRIVRFRRTWGLLSVEERAALESRKVFAKAVSRSMM